MQRGEVWWVEFDPAVGSKIRKTRPGIIVSNNSANRNLSRPKADMLAVEHAMRVQLALSK